MPRVNAAAAPCRLPLTRSRNFVARSAMDQLLSCRKARMSLASNGFLSMRVWQRQALEAARTGSTGVRKKQEPRRPTILPPRFHSRGAHVPTAQGRFLFDLQKGTVRQIRWSQESRGWLPGSRTPRAELTSWDKACQCPNRYLSFRRFQSLVTRHSSSNNRQPIPGGACSRAASPVSRHSHTTQASRVQTHPHLPDNLRMIASAISRVPTAVGSFLSALRS